jgi:hypothetical protein
MILWCIFSEQSTKMSTNLSYYGVVKGIYLKSGFDVIKDIASDVNLVFHPEGIRIIAPDPDMVTILRFEIPKSNLTYHDLQTGSSLSIGINTTVFYKMIRSVTATDTVEFEIHPDTPTVLKMTITSLTKISVTSLCSLPVPYVEMTFPEVTYQTTCELPTGILQRILRDMSVLSKKVTIATSVSPNEGPHLVVATGGDSSTTSISISPSVDGLSWITDTGALYHGRFFVKHIEQFLKPSFSKKVTLFMTENEPILLKYQSHAEDSGILLSMIVAPLPTF